MPIERIDHVTVLARDAIAAAEFFSSILGFEPGPRPDLNVPGVWLYCDSSPVLHIVEREDVENCRGALDHIAFWGNGLSEFIWRLESRSTGFKLKRIPDGGTAAGDWQLYFVSPDGARIEIGFPATEPLPYGWESALAVSAS